MPSGFRRHLRLLSKSRRFTQILRYRINPIVISSAQSRILFNNLFALFTHRISDLMVEFIGSIYLRTMRMIILMLASVVLSGPS